MQDLTTYIIAPPPFHVSFADWLKINPLDWPHRALRLIRPVSTSGYVSDGGPGEPYSDLWSLWRADVARTAYDLEPAPTVREHAWLQWGDGSSPGVAIRGFSDSGRVMQFTVATTP